MKKDHRSYRRKFAVAVAKSCRVIVCHCAEVFSASPSSTRSKRQLLKPPTGNNLPYKLI